MGLTEQLRVALRALSVNKLRSSLTMLGIIIGVGAVITLLSVGQGVQNLVTGQLQSIGTNLLFVVPGNMSDSQMQARSGSFQQMTLADAIAIGDPANAPDVVAVAPELMSSAEVSYGKKTVRVNTSGVTPDLRDRAQLPGDRWPVHQRDRYQQQGARGRDREPHRRAPLHRAGLVSAGRVDQGEQRPVQGRGRAGIEGRRRWDDGRQPG